VETIFAQCTQLARQNTVCSMQDGLDSALLSRSVMGDYIAWADYLLFIVFQYRLSRRAYIWASHKCVAEPCANITSIPLGNCCKHFFAFIRQEQAAKSIATSLHFFIPHACLCILRLFAACVAPKKQSLHFSRLVLQCVELRT